MHVRSARTLVFSLQDSGIIGFNFLSRSTFTCSSDLLTLLTSLEDWTALEDVAGLVPSLPEDALLQTVEQLIEVGAMTLRGSPLAEAEEEFSTSWQWGIPAAMFHFSLQDKKTRSLEQSEALQISKLVKSSQPKLYLEHEDADRTALRLPAALDGNPLMQLMARRRTVRAAASDTIALKPLSDCLFAGLGIVGETQNCAGKLPLSMTPSGGARNPYEAYVYARSVDGLDPGFYHYSAFDHSLVRVGTNHLPKPSELIADQEWTDQMPCVVFLCAFFERTMWKYDDANAYRVVLIEAGHIAQNLMLAATQAGLSACPSAALSHSKIRQCLFTESALTTSPVYALAIAEPDFEAAAEAEYQSDHAPAPELSPTL